MKVKELIKLLERFDSPEANVLIGIRQYNKRNDVATIEPWSTQHYTADVIINASLPKNMYTVKKNQDIG